MPLTKSLVRLVLLSWLSSWPLAGVAGGPAAPADRGAPGILSDQKRPVVIAHRYLGLPVKAGAPKRHVCVLVGGRMVGDYEICAADARPDGYACVDLAEHRGRQAEVVIDRLPADSRFFEAISLFEVRPRPADLYRERYRPQFHFSPKSGWTNDPNGLVYYRGEWHLFFQHNPYGTDWGNMTWGHAVSPDLVCWHERDDAIHPDRLGTIFSGSAVVDCENTTGFQTGAEQPIVCIYTSAGGSSLWSRGAPFAQSLAYSNDGGHTWNKYPGNPVLPHVAGANRDPKVIWHGPTRRWIMALYLDKNDYGLFASPDLKAWTHLHDITMPGSGECPDFFPLPDPDDRRQTKWVFTSAKGDYLVGDFDGRRFVSQTGPHPLSWGGHYYAVQTYSGVPATDGRRIQLAWMAGGQYPGMPFNQQMNFPSQLRLERCPEGLRLFRYPVREIERLRVRTHAWAGRTLAPGQTLLDNLRGELFDVDAEFEPAAAREIRLVCAGQAIAYHVPARQLAAGGARIPLAPHQGRIKLRVLVDRVSIDAYGNDGRVAICYAFLPAAPTAPGPGPLQLTAEGGPLRIVSLAVHELKSAWGDQ
jgi:sucrose-6-phosphate hydrolase SacC (GH32 family)